MLTAAMAIGCLVGCGQEAKKESSEQSSEVKNSEVASSETVEPTPEPKEPVALEWYYRGNGIQTDTQEVNDKINELLKEYPGLEHVTVNLNPFIGSDYKNGVLLAQTSGEQIDILGSVSLDINAEISNGTYLAIEDYLEQEEFAELKNALPDWLWQTMNYGGSIYAVPNYQRGANRYALAIPTEYLDCIDVELVESLLDSGCETIEDMEKLWAEMEKAVLAVREKTGLETKWLPSPGFAGSASAAQYGIGGFKDIISNPGFAVYADSTEVVNIYLTEEFKKQCEKSAEWYEKGLIKDDILVVKTSDYTKGNALKDEAMPVYIEQVVVPLDEEIFEGKMGDVEYTYIPINNTNFMINSWGAGGNGVTASCEHPEEALLFLQAINSGSELGTEIYNTVVYGIEGKHYEKIDDTHIKTLEYDGTQGGADTSYAAIKWIVGNTFNAYLNQGCNDSDMERDLAINENPNNVISPIMGFRFDPTNVATEISQCQAVYTEYFSTLVYGAKGVDWEPYYNEFVAKMTSAGCQKVITEMQRQYDAWTAANK